MNLLKIVLFSVLLINGSCENTSGDDKTSTRESTITETDESSSDTTTVDQTKSTSESSIISSDNPTTTTTTTTDNAGFTTFETSSTAENEATSSQIIDTDHDIIITAIVPPEKITSDSGLIGDISSTTSSTNSTVASTVSTAPNNTDITTESKESACSSSPCRNSGTCVDDSSIPPLLYCICPSGYVGIRCGTKDDCKKGDDGILCKNGACIYSDDGFVRSCKCLPGMHWHEEKRECREPDPPCFPNPCQNGGSCTEDEGTFLCDCATGYEGKNCSVQYKCDGCKDGICVLNEAKTAKYCKCNEGLYWNDETSSCESITLPCIPNPCKNGGTCNVLLENAFNCSCSTGFSGKACEIVDKCNSDEGCKFGECILSPENDVRKCKCEKGYFLEEKQHICKEIIEPCEPNPCSNDGICTVSSANTFNCTCAEGYTGSTCALRDKCKMDWGKTYCGDAECHNNFDLGIYYCSCKNDQYFAYSQRKCLKVDLCPLINCKTTEKCVEGECMCKEHYKNETGECKPDFCSSNPCPSPDMLCEEGVGSITYKCSCQEGYAFNGTHCINALCTFPHLNDCEQICTVTNNGYQCQCEGGFLLKEDNRTCLSLDNSTCSNKTCDKGSCVVENEIEHCICPPGYHEVSGKCVDLCSASQSSVIEKICPSGECETAKQTGFRCKCEGKYSLSKDLTTCMVRNVCEEGEIGWKTCADSNAECVQNWKSTNGFDCSCKQGQVVVEGVCTDICNLEINQRQCAIKGAYCDHDEHWQISCTCPPYFRADKDGICSSPADLSYLMTLPLDQRTYQAGSSKQRSMDSAIDYRKVSNDVSAMAKEMFEGFMKANILNCRMTAGYIICKIEMQFKTVHEADLKRLQSEDTCINKDDTNKCLLPPSLVLVKNKLDKEIDFKLTDPCDEDIKEEVCGSDTTCSSSPENKSFNCSCKTGFITRRKIYPFENTKSFIEICKDINECVLHHPCPLNSNCINTIGSFLCSCKTGYRRVKDSDDSKGEKCVEVCNPNPCTHGQCTARGEHEFDCKCDAGYGGTFCNLQDEHFKGARVNIIIVGAVLGGILLLTLILFAVCMSRLKKKKYIEDPNQMLYNSTEMVTPF